MQKNSNNNIVALMVGFLLILLIAVVTFFRASDPKDDSNQQDTPGQNVIINNPKSAAKISSTDLAKKIQNKDELILLDIRNEADYTTEHIFNSKNIPISIIKEALTVFDKGDAYVIIDSDASLDTIDLVAKMMSDARFKNISYLDGGFSAWKTNYSQTISVGDVNSFTDQSKITYTQTDGLKDLMKTETNLAIIDVRKSAEFNAGHIAGAMNIFLDDLEKRKKDIPMGKKIVLCDNNGLQAFQAGVRLFDMGFFNALTLADGLDNWKKKNYELVK